MRRDFFSQQADDLTPEERSLLEQLERDEELAPARRGLAPTHIGPDVEMEGRLVSRGSISIQGRLVGSASSGDTLRLEPEGRVEGDLSAVDVVVNGAIHGAIHARRRLELAAQARLSGRLLEQPEVLVIHEKARFG